MFVDFVFVIRGTVQFTLRLHCMQAGRYSRSKVCLVSVMTIVRKIRIYYFTFFPI